MNRNSENVHGLYLDLLVGLSVTIPKDAVINLPDWGCSWR